VCRKALMSRPPVHPATAVRVPRRSTRHLQPALTGQTDQGIDVCHHRRAGKRRSWQCPKNATGCPDGAPRPQRDTTFQCQALERPYEQVVNQARLHSQDNGYLRLSCAPLPPSSQVNTKAPRIPPLVTKGVSSPAGNWTVVPSLHVATTLLTTPR